MKTYEYLVICQGIINVADMFAYQLTIKWTNFPEDPTVKRGVNQCNHKGFCKWNKKAEGVETGNWQYEKDLA